MNGSVNRLSQVRDSGTLCLLQIEIFLMQLACMEMMQAGSWACNTRECAAQGLALGTRLQCGEQPLRQAASAWSHAAMIARSRCGCRQLIQGFSLRQQAIWHT